MARHFKDFLEAYQHYTDDNFVPENFNTWCGISAVAGALERKVWLPWSDTLSYYPNLYILMVALPGVGKSTALNKSVGLLQEMNLAKGSMQLVPSQVTEAKFIELMGTQTSFQHGTSLHNQSAGYYFASEASNSLRNVYGDFIACLTDFYDCPPHWEKATLKDDKITLKNLCLNLIAGSTFEYLSKLVTAEQVMGGFASRLIYVVHDAKGVKEQEFQSGMNGGNSPARKDFRRKLVEDLRDIHSMVGPFSGSPEFGAAWKAWNFKFEKERQEIGSEKLQSLMARVNTNALKLSMILSASESSERRLELHHWEKALAILEEPVKKIPSIFRTARAGNTESQDGLTQAVIRLCGKEQITTMNQLKAALMSAGFQPGRIDYTMNFMCTNGMLDKEVLPNGKTNVQLTIDPDSYL